VQKKFLRRWDKNYFYRILLPIANKLELAGYRKLKGFLNRLRMRIIEIKISSNNSMWRWKVANTERKLYAVLRTRTMKTFGVFKFVEAIGWVKFNRLRAFMIRLQRK
jgi:hypothetical protein